MSEEIDYDEMVEAMDEGMKRDMNIVECLAPVLRETLGLDKETILSFSEFALVLAETQLGGNIYRFSVNVVVREEDGR